MLACQVVSVTKKKLELFAKFESDGGDILAARPNSNVCGAMSQYSFRFLLAAFKRHTRFVLNLCATEEVLMFFTPCRVAGRRLKGFALAAHTASINCLPCWAETVQLKMHRAMLSLRAAPTAKLCRTAEAGVLQILPRQISYRGLPPWRKFITPTMFIPRWMDKWRTEYLQIGPGTTHSGMSEGRPKAFWISCPECGFWTDVCKIALLRRGRWRAIPCTQCNGTRAAPRWKCICAKRWAACETHSSVGRTCGARTHLLASHRNPKRDLPSSFHVDLEGYPIDRPRTVKKAKTIRALEFPPAETVEPEKAQVFCLVEAPLQSIQIQVESPNAPKRQSDQLCIGFRLFKKTRLLEATVVAPLCINSFEQEAAPSEAVHQKSGVKRQADYQKVPKLKIAKVNKYRSYLDDHPIAAINRLRMAKESAIIPFSSATSPCTAVSAQCNSQASHATEPKKACGSLEMGMFHSRVGHNQIQ